MAKFKPDEMDVTRPVDEMRNVEVQLDFTPNALGSVLYRQGDTVVLACATVAARMPRWFPRDATKGWVHAEYSLLPGSTDSRFQRERRGAKGRTHEIQRLIARALRGCIDLEQLGPHSVTVDCDVLNADGGTRCASITAAYIALRLAVRRLIANGACLPPNMRPTWEEKKSDDWVPPELSAAERAEHERAVLPQNMSAISVGMVDGKAYLDLDYVLDSAADVDMNVIMTSDGRFAEVQSTGEEATFSQEELIELLDLARKGAEELHTIQDQTLKGIE